MGKRRWRGEEDRQRAVSQSRRDEPAHRAVGRSLPGLLLLWGCLLMTEWLLIGYRVFRWDRLLFYSDSKTWMQWRLSGSAVSLRNWQPRCGHTHTDTQSQGIQVWVAYHVYHRRCVLVCVYVPVCMCVCMCVCVYVCVKRECGPQLLLVRSLL